MNQQQNGASRYLSYSIVGIFIITLTAFAVIKTSPPVPEELPQAVPLESVVLPEIVVSSAEDVAEVVTTDVYHQSIPDAVKGIYVSGWVAGTKSGMDRIMNLIQTTDINTIIIDIKDDTGRLSYQPLDETLQKIGVGTKRIANLPALIERLHAAGIYVVGRIAVFQDPYFAQHAPDSAFKDTRTGMNWHDNKGLAWLRTDDEKVWNYIVAIARDAHTQGFDEINLDYVRFPSDGPLSYLDKTGMTKSRPETMRDFFIFIDRTLRQESAIPLSADIFGLATSATGDLGIGQILEYIAPYVDYVAPMVYPSHFAKGTYGISNPAAEPYAIIHRSMGDAIKKMETAGEDVAKLRPWLQDFDLGAVYTADMVRAQITATEALGITSWMLWDPRTIYTKAAL